MNSFVMSKLDYCNSILAGLPQSSLQRLQKVQNHAVRVIWKVSKFHHTTSLLKILKWLPVTKRIDYKIRILTYPFFVHDCPHWFSHILQTYHPRRPLRSSNDERILLLPSYRTKVGMKAFRHQAPRLWNQLPPHVRCSSSMTSFKRILSRHLTI